MVLYKRIKWTLMVRSRNRLDGYRQHIMFENYRPKLFDTRREAREAARDWNEGLRQNPWAKKEPHGWLPYKVTRVLVLIDEA